MVALQRVERWILAGIGIAFLSFVTYLIWPRTVGPPLKGLGLPVARHWVGASHETVYSFRGDYRKYADDADVRLQIYGFRRRMAYAPVYENYRKENVSIWPGKWRPYRHGPGFVGVDPGWITIRFRASPNRAKQVWPRLSFKKKRTPVVRARTIVLGKP